MREKSQIKSPGKVQDQPIAPSSFSVADLCGIVPALPGLETDDFEDQIDQALSERADRIVREIEGQDPETIPHLQR